jgi:hypothetical protein
MSVCEQSAQENTVHMKAKVSRQFRTLCDENLCVSTG